MAIMYLLTWWYGRGWAWLLRGTEARLNAVNQTFSVGILLRTLFAPWKQIQTPGTFRNFFQSMLDNFISRAVGATVRVGMLLMAGVSTLGLVIGCLAAILLWPLLPLLIIGLPLASILQVGF